MSKAGTYKNYHGGYEELLTKKNYELWAPVIKREMEGRDQWGFIDNTRVAPEPLAADAPATDHLLYCGLIKEHRSDQAATGSYIFNSCFKII